MDIMRLIEDKLNDPEVLNKLTGSSDVETHKVKNATKLTVPAMLKALERNANSHEGAISLENALNDHKNDDINDVKRYLENVNRDEGDKVLSHMFGENKTRVQSNIARETGLGMGQTSSIMTQLAPLLLGLLGQKKSRQNVDSSGMSGFLGDILGNLMGGSNSGIMSKVTDLIDRDGDGNIMDDVSDMLGGFFKK